MVLEQRADRGDSVRDKLDIERKIAADQPALRRDCGRSLQETQQFSLRHSENRMNVLIVAAPLFPLYTGVPLMELLKVD